MANGPEIVKRYLKLKGERAQFDERWERMAPFIAPSRIGIITQYSPGTKQSTGVYDSTTIMAAETMAMFIAGHIINPSQRWHGYSMRTERVEGYGGQDAINEWLEECRDRTLKRLGASLFYAEGPESLIDYGGFGTGFLLTEEAPQPVNRVLQGFRGFYFHAEKTGRFVIQEGADGLVDTAGREFKLTVRIINDLWGATSGALPESIQNAVREAQWDRQFTIIHFISPRPRGEQTYGSKGMPWASCWIEMESKHILHEGGYHTFPAAVPRYHKTPGEVMGRGRGDIAFPDTWTLNTAKKMGLEDWALKIRPPIFGKSDSVMGSLRLIPAGFTSINSHGGRIQDAIMPFETGSHPEVSHINEEELRRSIREIFYVDAIRQLLQVEKSEMTAFEFAKKIELLFRLLGPVYGRLEWEYLHRIIDVVFDLQMRAGAFSPPPPEVYETDGQIDVVFQNPIAKAQRAGDAEALMLALGDLMPLYQALQDPSIFDRLNMDLTSDGILDLRGVPAKWQNNDDEIKNIRKARAERAQKENVIADAEQLAGAVGKATPALALMQGGGGRK